jgi:hypothetical protein
VDPEVAYSGRKSDAGTAKHTREFRAETRKKRQERLQPSTAILPVIIAEIFAEMRKSAETY